jgi:hypothetical protein
MPDQTVRTFVGEAIGKLHDGNDTDREQYHHYVKRNKSMLSSSRNISRKLVSSLSRVLFLRKLCMFLNA